ncbi:MAG: hypothetical protein AAF985_04835, partial [Bacteroidota bacterium]
RWGSVLFDTDGSVLNDLLSGWDGRSKGQLLNSGVYLYYVQIEFIDGLVEEFVGTVTILRSWAKILYLLRFNALTILISKSLMSTRIFFEGPVSVYFSISLKRIKSQ